MNPQLTEFSGLKHVEHVHRKQPIRSDDALSPPLIERLEALHSPDVPFLTDFQLQVEFSLDLQGRQQIIVVDASLNTALPFELSPDVTAKPTGFEYRI